MEQTMGKRIAANRKSLGLTQEQMAEKLGTQYKGNVFFVRKPAEVQIDMTYRREHDVSLLYDAYLKAMLRRIGKMPPKSERFAEIVERPVVSVTSRIVYIMRGLIKKGSYSFKSLFEKKRERSETVATFLALLELIRSGRVKMDHENMISLVKRNGVQNDRT